MLRLISAGRYEWLEERLVAALMQPGGSPFEVEPVLVPSAAVRRRLSLAIADRHGVCAQVEFSFLAQWLWQQIARVLPGIPARSPFDPLVLRWRIDDCLGDTGFATAHPRLATYLANADPAMRFALADRLAQLFDQYLTYRPDWLAAWALGGLRASRADEAQARADELWQSALWRRLLAQAAPDGTAAQGGRDPRSHPAQAFLAALAQFPGDSAGRSMLAQRLHIFCVPTMPPLYLDLLAGLARHIDIDLYVLNPCREYWLDLISAREHARRALAQQDQHSEVRHPLLAAWGRQTQAYLQLLLALEGEIALDEPEAGADRLQPERETLLSTLQQGICDLEPLEPGTLAHCDPGDGSLAVHACHSLMRELEVLHDSLLRDLTAKDPPAPGDILVVVPDLAAAAPLIEQVFGNAPARLLLPFVISGLPPAAGNPLARALIKLIELGRSRVVASGVLDVLQDPLVGPRFGLQGDSLEHLATLLRSAEFRWGFDADHRVALDLPETPRGTLSDGLERLLLAHALPDDHPLPWQERLPALACEGSDAQLLGGLARFVEALGQLRLRLAAPLLPATWCALLEDTIERFLVSEAGALEDRTALLGEVRAQAREFAEAARHAPLELEVLCQALQDRLAGRASGGVPSGAVTFAALPSLRSLPHAVVCILGLDDGVFPGLQRPLEFDLIAGQPRLGDRQRGDDERNLFLDLLLAARRRLHLSYVARDARDNSVRPPSVVLAELLDTLMPALCPAGADGTALAEMRGRLVCAHPLQPFDEGYFLPDARRLPGSFRYDLAAALRQRARLRLAAAQGGGTSAEWRSGAADEALAGNESGDDGEEPEEDDAGFAARRQPAFFASPLELPALEWRTLDLPRLSGFLQQPARLLLRERLGLQLAERPAPWEDAEDFLPDWQAAGRLARRLLPLLLDAEPPTSALLQCLALAGAEYPDGPIGRLALEAELASLQRFAQEVRVLAAQPLAEPREHRLTVPLVDGLWQLAGVVEGVRGGRLVGWSYETSRIGIELDVWLRHLWVCAHAAEGAAPQTCWVLRESVLEFQPLTAEQARARLADLLDLYREGLCRPVHFFPRTARTLLESGAWSKVRARWEGAPPHQRGESRDPAWRLALRGQPDPLDAEFERLASRVLGPLLEARR
jgi:exodeoxyribonuclease V gamma subunit